MEEANKSYSNQVCNVGGKSVSTSIKCTGLCQEIKHEQLRSLEAELYSDKRLIQQLLLEKISRLEVDLAARDREIRELKDYAQESFVKEKMKIVAEWESKMRSLIQDYDERMEREKKLYEEKQRECVELIAYLKKEVYKRRCGELEKLSKELNAKKLESEMMMTEKNKETAYPQIIKGMYGGIFDE